MLKGRQYAALLATSAALHLCLSATCGATEVRVLNLTPISAATHPSANAVQQGNQQAAFDQLVDEYFLASWAAHPNSGTEAGIHDYDDKMPDFSRASFEKRVSQLKQFRQKFESIDARALNQTAQIDRLMLIADGNSEIFELETLPGWQRDPDTYSSRISSAIFSLIKRNFSTPEQRMRSAIAREKVVPTILENARKQLATTPKIYTEIALEQLPASIEFFRTAVPAAFCHVKDPALQAEFHTTNDEVIKQLQSYQSFLKTVVLPRSTNEFAIGKENYQKKLLYNEMVDEPVESLLAKGEVELRSLQNAFVDTAKRIDPKLSPTEVYAKISSEHPKPDQLMAAVTSVLSGLHDKSQAFVTIPSEDHLIVQETPPCERATTFASMDTPGPYEKQAKEAYYNVTLPEKDWDAKRTEEHMRFFCTLDLINTSVHEAYPGHYVQGLWVKQAPSKARKLLGCGTNIEGWAHYCEQMMVENQPDNLPLKLVQVHDALLRACRYVCGIRMHTQGMTREQAKQFFITEGYQEPANADREAKRGTSDPTYLVYTLGKLQILALRDEYKKRQGDKFDLKTFHDQFLAQGMAPVKLIRQALLGQ